MCLKRNDEATEKFRKRNKDKKTITVWKLYRVNICKNVRPPHNDTGTVSPGFVVSNRHSIGYDGYDHSYYKEINRGIHVYLTRKEARKDRGCYYANVRIFKCKANMEDLVAVGGYGYCDANHAVFMKIHISKEEFSRGKKGRN